MYDKLDQLEPLVRETGPPVARMRVELPDRWGLVNGEWRAQVAQAGYEFKPQCAVCE